MSDQIPPKADLDADYFARWNNCLPAASRLAEIDTMIALILKAQSRYETVANKLPQPPWYVIALIHMREADLSFKCHLHNGDPLSARTVHVPARRPLTGNPPFTWEESAWDALRFDRLDKMDYSTVAGICYAMESYNGWGYRHHSVPSPYLWAGSNQQRPGKFVADGQWSSTQMDRQLGAMTVLRRMVTQGQVALRASEVAPTNAVNAQSLTAGKQAAARAEGAPISTLSALPPPAAV